MSIVNRLLSIGTRPSSAPSAERHPHHFLLAVAPWVRRRRQHPGGLVRRTVILSPVVMAAAAGAFYGLASAQGTDALQQMQGMPEIGEIIVEETLDPTDEGVVDWAVDRFREARLPLPSIRVSFHGDSDLCEGAQGGYRTEQGVSRVLICIPELGSSRERKLKRTLLHEFAHAWDVHFLTDETRVAFMELRDLEGWSFDVPYAERGREHAANTITWGLMDEPVLFGPFASPTPWEAQHSGYLTLTGAEPPHGYVWSLFAAGYGIYAHTPAQLEAVKIAWDRSGELSRRSDRIEVRFHRASETCGGEAISSRLIGDRLHIEACSTSTNDLAAALLAELTVRTSEE